MIFNRRVNGWETWIAWADGAVEIGSDDQKRYTDPATGICDACRKRRPLNLDR